MNCNQCRAKIVGKPGSISTSSKGGWCGSKRITRTFYVCQDCYSAGEYAQHLARLAYKAELLADLTPEQRARYETRRNLV